MDADLVYENIQSSEGTSSRRRNAKLDVVQQADHQIHPHWLWIVLWLSCSGNVLLAVIATRIYGLDCSSSTALNRSPQNSENVTGISNTHQCNESKTNCQLQEFRSHVRQHLCEATNAFTGNTSCSVCPVTWLLYEDKCYWFSTSILSWDQSYVDCAAKRSQLLVISNTEEQEFIQKKTKEYAWIGFKFKLPEKKWMWVDGSLVNQIISQPLMADCGFIRRKGIASDLCNSEFYWICQKPSVFI